MNMLRFFNVYFRGSFGTQIETYELIYVSLTIYEYEIVVIRAGTHT